jgi:hypothetical protein
MGIRINAYAIDLPRLEDLLDLPLCQFFLQLTQLPSDDDALPFSVVDFKQGDHYSIDARHRIRRFTQAHEILHLEPAELSTIPALRLSARAYLNDRNASACFLDFLLVALAQDPNRPIARQITSGYRRWWIGSLLAAANQCPSLSPGDFHTLRRLLTRILRGYDCGFPLADPEHEPPAPLNLPNDSDHSSAFFDRAEILHLLAILSQLLTTDPQFTLPPQCTRSPADDTDWNAYIRRLISHFTTWHELSPAYTHMVTLIG